MASSFQAFVTAKTGTLLGGVKRTKSVRFATKPAARAWLDQCIRTNREAGRQIDYARTGVETFTFRQPEVQE